MNIYSLPAILSFTINFSIAFIVLMEKPGARLNRWFAAFIFSFALWNLSEFIVLNSVNVAPALLGAQILYRIIFLAPAFYVIISYLFPRNFHKWAAKPLFYVAVFSLPVLALSLSFPDFQIQLMVLKKSPLIYYYKFVLQSRPTFLLLLFISLGYVVWGSVVMIRKIPSLRTIRHKNQTRFFVTGMILIFLIFVLIIVIKGQQENPISFYFLSTLFTFIIAVFFFIAIVRFHLFKPGKILSGGVTYTVLSVFTLSVYFFIVRAAISRLKLFFDINSSGFEAVLIVLLIIIILPFEKRLQSLFDRWLNKDIQQYRKNILLLFRELQAYYQPEEFYARIIRFVKSNFRSENVYLFSADPENAMYKSFQSHADTPAIPDNCTLIKQFKRKKGAIEFYALEHHDLGNHCHHFFEEIHARIFVPFFFENELLAIMILTRKKYGLEYSEDEMEILSIFGNEIAGILRRNQMIEEMREKDRQQFRLEKLAAIGQLTAGVAHEIRNPLNTISTSAETLLQKGLSEEDQTELKEFILEESSRLNRILSDFLNLSRIKPSNPVETDMEELFERLCLHLQNTGSSEIQIVHSIEADNCRMLTDPDLLFQVLLNLGLNALAAITERCQTEQDFNCAQGRISCAFKETKKQYVLSVSDNGPGIPEEIQESIYNPFFTTKESGTGLGLSIVHQIVEALSGSLQFESKPGHTRFKIYLPKNES